MRTFSLTVLAILVSSSNISYCQSNRNADCFTINGTINGRNNEAVVLVYTDKNNEVRSDTVNLQNGTFRFSGTINHVSEALLWADTGNREFDNASMSRFLLEPAAISFFAEKDRESTPVIRGSAVQSEKDAWDKVKASLLEEKAKCWHRIDSLYRLYWKTKIESYKTLADVEYKRRDSINGQIKSLDMEYVRQHRHSYLSMYLLSRYIKAIPVDSVQFYYTMLSAATKKSSVGNDVLTRLYPLTNDNDFRKANPLINAKFDERLRKIKSVYDLNLKDTLGNIVNLSRYKGKFLVLDFWTSSCSPCIENIPAYTRFEKAHRFDPIVFLSINLDIDPDRWKTAIRKYNFQSIHLSDMGGFSGLAAVYNKVVYVPKYVIADKEGNIINYQAPQPLDAEFKKTIDGLLK